MMEPRVDHAGLLILKAMDKKKWSPRRLSLEAGVELNTVYRVCRSAHPLKIEVAIAIGKVLGLDPLDLLLTDIRYRYTQYLIKLDKEKVK